MSSNRFRLTENRFASVSLVAFLLYMSISQKDIPHCVELISDPGTGLKPRAKYGLELVNLKKKSFGEADR